MQQTLLRVILSFSQVCCPLSFLSFAKAADRQ